MNVVVYRGARTREIEIRVTEAPALAKERGGHGVSATAPGPIAPGNAPALRADPRCDRAIPGRIPARRRSRADDLAGAAEFPASSAPDRVNGIVLPVDGGWPGR
ncbi:hypothetical protein [Streptomyces stelliscabiei]|uniref:2-deoxy-D-gluconate 3-dehydrogenase n=1 Tax=Streptomyces stelliscabiei TaxID=146820 RepID=A0A8I0P0X8_9ACTN|nr:hypothetical protein [Streptomyces stelliscabiei]KND23715.1 hypothetical protein IQ64_47725 [Streptomyces stelliscabiei]MBE1594015.1 2-deoxy-D-gluconate 3-dehydrogenase [Streptomyces stelliscabiei]MDX2521458.1 hypothetical protein [Streptomyces stelliscabiei]MDX2556166.1 hypothetical protein [Streptomyces stelliscabiei]MDX2616754.1 hypothetical protein [Streptomyces stelliscabiei]